MDYRDKIMLRLVEIAPTQKSGFLYSGIIVNNKYILTCYPKEPGIAPTGFDINRPDYMAFRIRGEEKDYLVSFVAGSTFGVSILGTDSLDDCSSDGPTEESGWVLNGEEDDLYLCPTRLEIGEERKVNGYYYSRKRDRFVDTTLELRPRHYGINLEGPKVEMEDLGAPIFTQGGCLIGCVIDCKISRVLPERAGGGAFFSQALPLLFQNPEILKWKEEAQSDRNASTIMKPDFSIET